MIAVHTTVFCCSSNAWVLRRTVQGYEQIVARIALTCTCNTVPAEHGAGSSLQRRDGAK